jgi:hypothetical protein
MEMHELLERSVMPIVESHRQVVLELVLVQGLDKNKVFRIYAIFNLREGYDNFVFFVI